MASKDQPSDKGKAKKFKLIKKATQGEATARRAEGKAPTKRSRSDWLNTRGNPPKKN